VKSWHDTAFHGFEIDLGKWYATAGDEFLFVHAFAGDGELGGGEEGDEFLSLWLGEAGPLGVRGDAGLLNELFPKSGREGIPTTAQNGLPTAGLTTPLDFFEQGIGLGIRQPCDAEGKTVIALA
jgi:hypothetical protein